MDEQIPSLNQPFDIPNIPISVPIPLPVISHQTTQNQAQISSDYMLNLFNPLCSSSISTIYDNNYKPLASPSVSINKAKNVGSHEVDHKISGSENKANKIPAMSRKKKSAPQRIAFHTRTDNDVLDDGFRWRKYGQKTVKNSNHPRYYVLLYIYPLLFFFISLHIIFLLFATIIILSHIGFLYMGINFSSYSKLIR